MRLFVAAELPEEMLEALAETSALLRDNVRGRYVGADSFHVTLAFLGEVESRRAEDASYAIEEACLELRATEAELGELGCFGRRSAATLWQGFSNPGVLPEAARNVRGELTACGFAFDAKKFIPHITLMRAAKLNEGVLPAPFRTAGFIDRITLFRSDLSGPRPVYDPLFTQELPR